MMSMDLRSFRGGGTIGNLSHGEPQKMADRIFQAERVTFDMNFEARFSMFSALDITSVRRPPSFITSGLILSP